MDNYLISNHILKCTKLLSLKTNVKGKVVDSGKLHKDTFKGANKKFTAIPWQKVERMRHNREKTQEQTERIQKKLIEKENEKRMKMHVMGISYDFPGYAACSKVVA
jgi:nucleolar protein 15